jgi:hypothetical protein
MGFSMLSNSVYMLGCCEYPSGAIQIYSFENPTDDETMVNPPTRNATLFFPEVNPGITIDDFYIFAATSTNSCLEDLPFHSSRDSKIFGFSIIYHPNPEVPFGLFVRNQTLLSYSKGVNKIIKWAEWGPKNSRFLEHRTGRRGFLRCISLSASELPCSRRYRRSAHGQRVVIGPVIIDGNPSVQVYDFSPNVIRQNIHTNNPFHNRHVISSPTRIFSGEFFAWPIETTLPYAVTTRRLSGEYTGFMIDEERIIAHKVNSLFIQWLQIFSVFAEHLWACL